MRSCAILENQGRRQFIVQSSSDKGGQDRHWCHKQVEKWGQEGSEMLLDRAEGSSSALKEELTPASLTRDEGLAPTFGSVW